MEKRKFNEVWSGLRGKNVPETLLGFWVVKHFVSTYGLTWIQVPSIAAFVILLQPADSSILTECLFAIAVQKL